MKKVFLLTVSMAAILLVPGTVFAVEYGGIGGRPAYPRSDNPRTGSIFIYQLSPGKSTTDGVKIYNNTDKQRTIALESVDSVLSSGGAFSCAQAVDPKNDVGRWLTLKSRSIEVPAHGNQIVPFVVTVPGKADVGEHDGCITIQDASMTAPTDKSGVVLSFRSAIRVVVTVPGDIIKKLSLASVTVNTSHAHTYIVSPVAQNDGNVSLDTKVAIRFVSLFGVSGKQEGGTYPVLPHSRASWNFELAPSFWGGWYRAQVAATYNSNPTAQLGTKNGEDKNIQLASALFFVMPKPLAGAVYLVALLALGAGAAWFVNRHRDVRRIQRDWKTYLIDEGDTITELAKQHHTTWKKVARVNKLKPPYTLHKNQKLRLPSEAVAAPPSIPKLRK